MRDQPYVLLRRATRPLGDYDSGGSIFAWLVNFSDGSVGATGKIEGDYVRAVRGGL